MKVGLPLIKTVFTLLAKSELIKLGLIAASETQIQKKILPLGTYGLGKRKKKVTETTENEIKCKKLDFVVRYHVHLMLGCCDICRQAIVCLVQGMD